MSYKKFWILNVLLFIYARQGVFVFLWLQEKIKILSDEKFQQGHYEQSTYYIFLLIAIFFTHVAIYVSAKCYIVMKRLEALGISKKLAVLGLGVPLSFGFDFYLLFKTKKYEANKD